MEFNDNALFILTIVLGVLTIINFVSGQKDKASKSGKGNGEVLSTLISIQDKLVDLKSDTNEIKNKQNEQGLEIATLKESARQFEEWKKAAEKRIHILEITIAGGESNE
jgi:hypothetical protein